MRAPVVSTVIWAVAAFGSLWLGLNALESPLVAGPRPPGVSDRSLQQVTLRALTACTTTTSAAPDGCPQRAPGAPDVAHWTLIGDPTMDSSIEYLGRGRFEVYGGYAMVVRYTDVALAQTALPVEGRYIAFLHTNGAKDIVDRIVSTTSIWPRNRPGSASDSAARGAALAALKTCISSPSLLLCPRSGGTPQALQFSGDQTKNSAVTFDDNLDVLHVKGTLVTQSGALRFDVHETVTQQGLQAYYVDFR